MQTVSTLVSLVVGSARRSTSTTPFLGVSTGDRNEHPDLGYTKDFKSERPAPSTWDIQVFCFFRSSEFSVVIAPPGERAIIWFDSSGT